MSSWLCNSYEKEMSIRSSIFAILKGHCWVIVIIANTVPKHALIRFSEYVYGLCMPIYRSTLIGEILSRVPKVLSFFGFILANRHFRKFRMNKFSRTPIWEKFGVD